MKIINENGAVVENPDLTLGYLVGGTEPVEHPAVEGVEEQWHWETVTEYPNGGRDVQKIVDRPGVTAQEEERKKAEARKKLPETVAALQEDNKTLKEENAMLKQCLLEMSEIVYA